MAATILRYYLSDETSLRKDFKGVAGDSAYATFIVGGLDVDRNDNADAIDVVKSFIGSYHYSISNLPVAAITSKKIGPDLAKVRVDFRRSEIDVPTVPAHKLARIRVATTGQRNGGIGSIFRMGAPGTFLTWLDASLPNLDSPIPSERVIETIFVPTVLSSNPADVVRGYTGLVNSGAIKLSGAITQNGGDTSDYQYPQHTLLFRGVQVTPIETRCGVVYRADYMFDHSRWGWVQTIAYNEELDGDVTLPESDRIISKTTSDGIVTVVFLLSSNVMDFAAKFPTHVPVGCS